MIEITIVMGLLLLLIGTSFPLMMDFYRSRQMETVSEGLVQALRKAQMKAMTGENDSAFGVSISAQQYVIFKGESYSGRDSAFDEAANFPPSLSVEFSDSGLSEVYFSKMRGTPSSNGTIDLLLGGRAERVAINEVGKISYERMETAGGMPIETVELLTGSAASSWTSSNAPYNTYYMDSIAQSIYLKSDLNAAGISGPAAISEVCLQCSSLPGRDIANLRIKMKNTSASSLYSFDTSGLTVVYGPTSYTRPAAGDWVCHSLSSPFGWDGSSNLLVEVYRNDDAWISGGGNYMRSASSGRTYAGYCDNCSGCAAGQDCYSPSFRGSFSRAMNLKITYVLSY